MHNSNNIVMFSSMFEIIIGFSQLNNERKYLYIYLYIFLVLFSKINEYIFLMKIYFLII